jgi:hypothetical protein
MPHYASIDANILLSLYDYTDDDLQKLEALVNAVDDGKVVLYLTKQAVDEFRRNRDKKLADIISALEKKPKGDKSLPRLCDGLPERDQFLDAMEAVLALRTELINQVRSKAAARELAADALIEKLIGAAKTLTHDHKTIEAARERRDLGQPPGKRDSLGDQVIWETLLASVGKGQPLTILSKDGDWVSPLTNQVDPILVAEWQARKGAQLTLARTLNDFLKGMEIDVEISVDPDKEFQVNRLCTAGSFSTTHAAIEKLVNYDSFNPPQVNKMVDAFLDNAQIRWIAGDQDVNDFYTKLLAGHAAVVDAEKFVEVMEKLNPSKSDATDFDFL